MKKVFAKSAFDMEQFTERLQAETPLLQKVCDSTMNAVLKVSELSLSMNHDKASAFASVDGLRASIGGAKDSTIAFRKTVASLPSMSKELIRARKDTVRAMEQLVIVLTNAEALLIEATLLFKFEPPDS